MPNDEHAGLDDDDDLDDALDDDDDLDDVVPESDEEFDAFVKNFVAVLSADPTEYGITAEELAELTAKHEEWVKARAAEADALAAMRVTGEALRKSEEAIFAHTKTEKGTDGTPRIMPWTFLGDTVKPKRDLKS